MVRILFVKEGYEVQRRHPGAISKIRSGSTPHDVERLSGRGDSIMSVEVEELQRVKYAVKIYLVG